MKRRGFTLVELSIVLVIIGLLSGGILAARSMIKTAQVNSFVKQIQQYDVAVGNFQTTYKCLPGDCTFMSPAGNNDGLIEDNSGAQDDYFTGEIAGFWNILSSLGFVKSKVIYSIYASSSGIRAGVNVPSISLGKNTGVIATCEWENGAHMPDPTDMQDYADWKGRYNYYHLFSTANTVNSLLHLAPGLEYSISPSEALSVDSKMDDGNAITGNVRVAANDERKAYFAGVPVFNQTAGSGCVMPGDNSRYNLDSTSAYPCALMIPIMSQLGNK